MFERKPRAKGDLYENMYNYTLSLAIAGCEIFKILTNPQRLSEAVFRHILLRISAELGPHFLQRLTYSHAHRSRGFSAQTRSQHQHIVLRIQVRGGAAGWRKCGHSAEETT